MYRPVLSYIIILLLLLSCNKSTTSLISVAESDGDCVSIYLFDTRAGVTDSTTYRVLLHKVSEGNDTVPYPYLNNSGTYRNQLIHNWLKACIVEPTTGKLLSDNMHIGGLRAGQGNYFISFVSPAKAPVKYDIVSVNNFKWGYCINRTDSPFYLSSPFKVSLTGNHFNQQQVFDVSDSTLLFERRAKIKLVLHCGRDLTSVTVNKAGWTNLYSEAYFNIGKDSLEKFTLMAPTDTVFTFTPASPVELKHETGSESVIASQDFYVFALGYADEDESHRYKYERPKLHIYVEPRIATIEVLHSLLPNCEYIYDVSINSAYISVDVTASTWANGGSSDGTINAPDAAPIQWTVPNAWLNGGSDSGIIDSGN